MIMSEKDQTVIALDDIKKSPTLLKSGSMSRTLHVLEAHPEGLTVEDICEFTGLANSTVRKKGVEKLFHFQLAEDHLVQVVDRIKDPERGKVYRVRREIKDLSIVHDHVKRRP